MTGGEADELRREVAELQQRLQQLADRVASIVPEDEAADESPPPPSPDAPVEVPANPATPAEDAVPVSSLASTLLGARDARDAAEDEAAGESAGADRDGAGAGPGPAPPLIAPAVATPRRDLSRVEWLVGTRGVALLGVVILVIAAGLFLKEAWDRGWIGQVPDWLRCVAGAVTGLALVGAGELLRRRVSALASTGVSAAGLAIVYGAILAAAELYALLSVPVAFGLLAAVALVGIWLGSIGDRVLLAGLSLVGAFLVPFVIGTSAPSTAFLPAYLVSLLVLGLGLAGWRGPAYATIRRLAFWGVAGVGTVWAGSVVDVAPASVIGFVAVVWSLTIAELVLSARFFRWLRPDRTWPDDARPGLTRSAAGTLDLDLARLLRPSARWLLTAFGVTTWSVMLAGWVVLERAPHLDWLVPAGFGAAAMAVAAAVWPREAGRSLGAATPRSALASVMGVIAAALVVLAIATGLVGRLQVGAWATIGLAAVLFARRVRFRAANVFGLGLLAIAAGRLLVLDLPSAAGLLGDGPETELLRFAGLAVTAWSLQLLAVGAATTVAAAAQREEPYRSGTSWAAMAGFALACLGPGSEPESVGAAWALIAAAATAVGARTARPEPCRAAPALAGLGMLLALAALADAWRPAPAAAWIAWTEHSTAMAIIAAAWIGLAAWRERRVPVRAASVLLAIASLAAAVAGGGTAWATTVLVAAGLVAGVGIAAGWRAGPPAVARRWGLIPVTLVGGTLVAAATVALRVDTDWSQIGAGPLAHAQFWSAVLAAGALLIAAWRMSPEMIGAARLEGGATTGDDGVVRATRVAAGSIAGGVLLMTTASEVVRVTGLLLPFDEAAQGAALSVWCSLFAAALIWGGIVRREGALRWPGLALLGLTAAKVLVLDLSTLTPMWRIAGSASVGLVLLAAGVAYAWLMRTDGDGEEGDPGPAVQPDGGAAGEDDVVPAGPTGP